VTREEAVRAVEFWTPLGDDLIGSTHNREAGELLGGEPWVQQSFIPDNVRFDSIWFDFIGQSSICATAARVRGN
jgi:hypothetical protein